MVVDNFLAKIFAFVIILLINLVWFFPVFAQQCPTCNQIQANCPTGRVCICNPLRWCNIHGIVEGIVGFLFWFGIALFPLMILVGAFYIMTSGGNERRLATGKRIIFYAIIGFLLILLAKGVIGIIKVILGVT